MMQANRRTILKAAAAAPIAAVVGAPAGADPAAVQVVAQAPAAYPWQWWLSYDGERYSEPCNTFAEAMKIAKAEGYNFVTECQQGDYDLNCDGSDILELLYGRNEELMGEDGEFIHCTPEQELDLGKMVSATIQEWCRKHSISTTAWVFTGMRGETRIEHPKPASLTAPSPTASERDR